MISKAVAFVVVVAGLGMATSTSWIGGSGPRVPSISCDRVLERGGEDAGELIQLAAAAAAGLPSGVVNCPK